MANEEKVIVTKSKITNLADKVRAKAGTSIDYSIDAMADTVENFQLGVDEETLYTSLNEMKFGAGYTLTLNVVTSVLMNSTKYTYSINDGYTWNKFNGFAITLQNVNRIQFKNDQAYYEIKIGSTENGSDLGIVGPESTSNNYIVNSDTTYYLSASAGGAN